MVSRPGYAEDPSYAIGEFAKMWAAGIQPLLDSLNARADDPVTITEEGSADGAPDEEQGAAPAMTDVIAEVDELTFLSPAGSDRGEDAEHRGPFSGIEENLVIVDSRSPVGVLAPPTGGRKGESLVDPDSGSQRGPPAVVGRAPPSPRGSAHSRPWPAA